MNPGTLAPVGCHRWHSPRNSGWLPLAFKRILVILSKCSFWIKAVSLIALAGLLFVQSLHAGPQTNGNFTGDAPDSRGAGRVVAQEEIMAQRRAEAAKLGEILRSSLAAGQKREAVENYRASLEGTRTPIAEPTAEERIAARARMQQWLLSQPEPRRAMMREQLQFAEELEALRMGGASLAVDERSARMVRLIGSHRTKTEQLRAAPQEETSRPRSAAQQAVAAEVQKLQQAMRDPNLADRRQTIEQFRAALKQIREMRLQPAGQK